MRWSPERLDQLERAVRDGRRVAVDRRGTEYIVTPVRITQVAGREALIARLPMTGDEMTFVLEDLEGLRVLGEV
jgi:uncharacterized protein with PhoU and TrkA domain